MQWMEWCNSQCNNLHLKEVEDDHVLMLIMLWGTILWLFKMLWVLIQIKCRNLKVAGLMDEILFAFSVEILIWVMLLCPCIRNRSMVLELLLYLLTWMEYLLESREEDLERILYLEWMGWILKIWLHRLCKEWSPLVKLFCNNQIEVEDQPTRLLDLILHVQLSCKTNTWTTLFTPSTKAYLISLTNVPRWAPNHQIPLLRVLLMFLHRLI